MSTQVDLTRLPPPQIIEEPEFKDIPGEMRNDLRRRASGFTAGQLDRPCRQVVGGSGVRRGAAARTHQPRVQVGFIFPERVEVRISAFYAEQDSEMEMEFTL